MREDDGCGEGGLGAAQVMSATGSANGALSRRLASKRFASGEARRRTMAEVVNATAATVSL